MSAISSISTSGLIAAQTDVAVVAANVANATDQGQTAASGIGSSAVPVTTPAPLTGAQPSNSAALTFQALTATNSQTASGGVTASVSSGGTGALSPDIIGQAVALNSASAAYQYNIATLKTSENLAQQSAGLVA